MARILGVSLFALLAAMAPAVPGSAEATTIHESGTVPIQGVITNPCTGEEIAYSGESHFMFHVTLDASGGAHGTGHINLQGVTGVGLTSGEVYQIAAQDGSANNFAGATELTTVENTVIVGPGPDNNFRTQFLFHTTCNSSGCSVQFINTESSCQG